MTTTTTTLRKLRTISCLLTNNKLYNTVIMSKDILYTIVAYLNIIEPDDVAYVARTLDIKLPDYLNKTTDVHEYSRVWSHWFSKTKIYESRLNSQIHSLDDIPYTTSSGHKYWLANGKFHRVNGTPESGLTGSRKQK